MEEKMKEYKMKIHYRKGAEVFEIHNKVSNMNIVFDKIKSWHSGEVKSEKFLNGNKGVVLPRTELVSAWFEIDLVCQETTVVQPKEKKNTK